MKYALPRKGTRYLLGLCALVFATSAHAGNLTFVSGSWSNLSGTAASTPALYVTSVTPNGVSASLSVSAPSSGTNTIQGTWSFTVNWSPSTTGETPPANVSVLLKKSGTPTVDGNGVAQILQGTTQLLNVDATCLFLSGITAYLPDVTLSFPLTLQSDGTYKATGSVSSDLISATYNSLTTTVSSCRETLTLGSMDGVS